MRGMSGEAEDDAEKLETLVRRRVSPFQRPKLVTETIPTPTGWIARHADGTKSLTTRPGAAKAFEALGDKVSALYELPEGCFIVQEIKEAP